MFLLVLLVYSNQVLAVCGPYTIVFFMIVVFFGAFYLINLMLAVVAMSYDDEAGVTNQVGSVFSFPFSRTSCLRSIIRNSP